MSVTSQCDILCYPCPVPDQRKEESRDGLRLDQWVFTGVLFLFLLGVFFLGPEQLPSYKQPVLTLLAATFAGFLGFFLSGKITLHLAGRSTFGRLAVQAAGGTALFVLVLWWWPVAEPVDPPAVYRIQVTVLDLNGQPEEEAEVSSVPQGVVTSADGVFVIEIPAGRVPADRQVTLRAAHRAAFLAASTTVELRNDHEPPPIELQLEPVTGAQVSGHVVDGDGKAVEGARVRVQGRPGHAVTDANGYFELAAGAAAGQMITLHAEKADVGTVTQSHPAGSTPVTVELRAER